MKIAVLFDGGGLARLGLEEAGHECIGFELDPWKHYLSTLVGSGNCVSQDATKVDLSDFDGVWASPPCQWHSSARDHRYRPKSYFSTDYLDWCLKIGKIPLWVENVTQNGQPFGGGTIWNAAQFTDPPRQNRNRCIAGYYKSPSTLHRYKKIFPGVCPTILATEHRGCASDRRKASRFYERKLTIEECAWHQGFEVPQDWYLVPDTFTKVQWNKVLYEAIGNGVPVYMARAFGEAYPVI